MSVAPASAARILANRRNALRSTGPRTPAGKERSRANSLRHGLAGAGVALPVADEAAVAAEYAAFAAELAPKTRLGATLLRQVALMSVRMERSARHEAASIATRVGQAQVAFDADRRAEVDRLMDALPADPAANHPPLLALPEGVDRLVDALLALMDGLVRDAPWTPALARRAEALCGRGDDGVSPSPLARWSRAVGGDLAALGPADAERARSLAEPDRPAWLVDRLILALDDELAQLCSLRATMDDGPAGDDRRRAADLALFDAGAEATLARRYEAASSRAFYRALREFHQAEAAADPLPAAAEPVAPILPDSGPETGTEPEGGSAMAAAAEQILRSRATLGSFGAGDGRADDPAPPTVDEATRRKNRPRVDQLLRQQRRRR